MQPNTSQPTQPQAPVSEAPAPGPAPTQKITTGGKKSKKNLIIGGVVVAILLVAGVAYGVYAYVTNTPDYLLSTSLDKISKETAIAAKFKFQTGTEATGSSVSGDFAVRTDDAAKAGEAVIGIGSGSSRVAVDAMAFEDAMFIRMSGLANLGALSKSLGSDQSALFDTAEFKAALKNVENQWYKLDKETLKTFASENTGDSLKVDDLKRVVDIYNKHRFFKSQQAFADETIDGEATGHFNITMDKPAYKAFLVELKAANLSSVKVTDQDITNSDKDADDFNKNSSVEFWVTRSQKKLKQLKITDKSASSPSAVTLTFVTNLPTFPKLEKPTNAKPASDLITTLLGPSLMPSVDTTTLENELMQ